MALTKQDLEAIEGIVKSSVETIVEGKLLPVRQDIKELRDDVKALREQIQELTVTLRQIS